MFIFEGIPAEIWATIWWFTLKDMPEEVSWLSAQEKKVLAAQLGKKQKDIQAVGGCREELRSRNMIFLCLQYFFWSVGVYGFMLWLPSILSDKKAMGMVGAGWLSSAPYLVATVAMILVSWASDKMQNRKLFVWPLLLARGLAFFAS